MRVSAKIFFLFILTCASRPEPKWINSQPQAQGYWFGIGIIEKPFYGDDCREEALNKALSEISSQISVEVTGSFKQVVVEHNLTLDQFAESIIQTRVDKNLSHIEIVDFFNNKDKCGLLARLSHSIYNETIERQRRNAVQSILGLLAQAESDFSIRSFAYLSEAINEIVPYMDIPIEEKYPAGSDKTVNLYRYIKVMVNKYLNRLSLYPEQEILEIRRGFSRDIQLNVRVVDGQDNAPMENIPVISYIKEKGQNPSALSDEYGNCMFPIPLIPDNQSIQYVNYEVNIDEILINRQLLGTISPIKAQTVLQVTPPQIFIQVLENNLGFPTDNPYIQPVIVEFFSRHLLAKFVDTDVADLIINGLVNTRAVSDTSNDYGIYQVFGDVTISISNGRSGEDILEKSYNNVQGSDFHSNREAANQSLKKISEKITEEFLPEIMDLIKGL